MVTVIKLLPNALKSLYNEILQRLRFSISFKITAAYTWLFTRLLISLSIMLWIICTLYMGNAAEEKVAKDFNLIKYYLENSTATPVTQLENLSSLAGSKISIFDNNKKLLYSTDNSNTFYSKKDTKSLNKNFLLVFNGSTLTENSLSLILNNSLKLRDTSIYVQVNYNLFKEFSDSVKLFIVFLCINGFYVLLSIGPGSKASKKLLSPIDAMSQTVNGINISALDTRLDISGSQDELKDLAKTFNNMLDRLQHSYELQNEFVSDASHELRTPISVIQGYINLLDRWGKNDAEVLAESITAIKSEAENMKNLVENLLFLARGDKNTQKVEFEEFNLNELIDEIVKETKLIDSEHNIVSQLSINIKVYADKSLLKQALRIFIDNSIKYTESGGTIKISCTKENAEALITIEDNGIGISKEDLPNIFNRFYRADKSRTKETGGTGLGLAIAKWIILKHKGTIAVESQLNVGTKFIIRLG